MKKKIFFVIIILLALIQFKTVEKTNPDIILEQDFFSHINAPLETKSMIKNACYDCHSNETKYPWYFNVAPISWWTRGHVDNARENLNFSIWSTYPAKKQLHKLEECVEMIEEKQMPVFTYMLLHKEAKINDEDRKNLALWLNETSDANYKK